MGAGGQATRFTCPAVVSMPHGTGFSSAAINGDLFLFDSALPMLTSRDLSNHQSVESNSWRSGRAMRELRQFGVAAAVALSAFFFANASAQAVVVGTYNDTTVNPAAYQGRLGPDWTLGDPGWDNVTTSGTNYVYLGNGWVIGARHSGVWSATFSTGQFTPVANVIVHNPPAALAGGYSLTTETDLRLIRLNSDPGLPALKIATSTPPLSGNAGSEVMFIGQGRTRWTNGSEWSFPNPNNPQTPWSQYIVTSGGQYSGYQTADTRAKRWGTNRLANPGGSEYRGSTNTFSHVLNSRVGVLPLETADNKTRDVISMVTRFDKNANGSTPFESQSVTGNSGSAVFYNFGTAEAPDWALAGIVNATVTYAKQPISYAVYGNSTTFADLSYYNQAYKSSICDIMRSCGNYSILGDVNLDGMVTGDGTGAASEDDVTAFVEGFGYMSGFAHGDYESWKKGDMNLDGQTTVADFLLLRSALNGPIGSGALATIFGGVPEPSSAALALLSAACLATGRRRRL